MTSCRPSTRCGSRWGYTSVGGRGAQRDYVQLSAAHHHLAIMPTLLYSATVSLQTLHFSACDAQEPELCERVEAVLARARREFLWRW